MFSGNFPEIYDVLNIQWHREAVAKYGKLFQINGMFGVSDMPGRETAA